MCTATLVTGRARLWTFATLIVLAACAGNPEAPLDILDPDQLPGGGTTVSGDLTGQLPVAVIDASVTAGIVPVSVRFNAAGSWSTLGAIAAYAWDFGDGNTSDAAEVYHTFVEPGTYAVQLTVYDNLGQAGSAVVQIVALPPVQIMCVPACASGPAPLSVELAAATIGGAGSLPDDVQCQWDFGDGLQGTGPSIVHLYRQPGRYVVTLALAVGALLLPGDDLTIVVDVPAGGDNQPPVADAGPNQIIVDDDGDGSALVPLDGRASYDPDGTIVWYRWSLEAGPGAPVVLAEGSAPLRQVPLPLGEYDITLTVTDNKQATGQDSTKAAIIVAAILDVSPTDDFSSAGPLGGPFTPGDTAYTLRNTGQQPLVWSAGAGEAWVTLSPASGTLAAGEADVVTVTINPGAIALGTGVHKDTVTFANLTSNAGTTSRDVELTVTDPTLPLISGRVTVGGSGLAGVVMNGLPGNPSTNANGDYVVSVAQGWSGTVTPSKAGYTFSPVSRTYNNVTGNQTSQNYAATLQSFTISGRVTAGGSGLAGVVMNGLPGNPSTNASGDYTASVPYGWSGTVTPSKAGYTFSPVSRTYSNVTANQTSQNYAATLLTFTISGRVTEGGSGLAGVVLNGLPTPPTTNASGDYTASVPYGWSGTVAPSKDGYAFTPVNRAYSNVTSHQADQDYTGTPSQQQMASQISQYGITWTFDQPYRVGQFVNGDWWVCPDSPDASVVITSVAPPPTTILQTNHQDLEPAQFRINGSMVNPPGNVARYDERIGGGVPHWTSGEALYCAYPLILAGGSSLVSTVSWLKDDPGRPIMVSTYPYAPRPALREAAILTVLSIPPPANSFRPPYCGTAKPLFNLQHVRSDLLPSLASVPSTPSLSSISSYFARPWLDNQPDWPSRYIHPTDHMPDYGAGLCNRISEGAVMLCVNDAGDRSELLVRYVQLGIDLFGIGDSGGSENWRNSGGHQMGRKWPILFAGFMLSSGQGGVEQDCAAAMLGIGHRPHYPALGMWRFQEDEQTFYVSQGDVDRVLDSCFSGTAQGGTPTTMILDPAHLTWNRHYPHYVIDQRVYLTGGTGAGQMRVATAWNQTTNVAEFSPPWTIAPDATTTYEMRGYEADMLGTPEWGQFHVDNAVRDCPSWFAGYRTIVGPTLPGIVLAARACGLKDEWDHDALFDYMDRYMQVTAQNGAHPGYRALSGFVEDMWDAYRADFTD